MRKLWFTSRLAQNTELGNEERRLIETALFLILLMLVCSVLGANDLSYVLGCLLVADGSALGISWAINLLKR